MVEEIKKLAETNVFIKDSEKIQDICRISGEGIEKSADKYIRNQHLHRTAELMSQLREFLHKCNDIGLDAIVRCING